MKGKNLGKRLQVLVLMLAVMVVCVSAVACIAPISTITFVNGEQTVSVVEIDGYLTASQIPEAEQVEGSVFEGWFVGETKVEAGYTAKENVTAVAVYTKTYNVVFIDNGEKVKEFTAKNGETVGELPTPAGKENHEFLGWFVGETIITEDYAVTENLTVNAVYAEEFTVTFTNNGEEVSKLVVLNGKTLGNKIPEPATVENYLFLGWFNGETEATAEYAPTASVEFTAKYVALRTVTFMVEGSEYKVVKVADGSAIELNEIPQEPEKENYSFEGWFNGEEQFNSSTTFTSDVVYTAKFNLAVINVDFVVNGEVANTATVNATEEGKFVLSASNIPANPEVEGSVFYGWYNGTEKVEAGYVLTGETTVQAFMVNQESYVGIWMNSSYNKFTVTNDNGELTVNFNEDNYADWSYNEEDATIFGRYSSTTYTVKRTVEGINIYWYDYGMDYDGSYDLTAYNGTSPVDAGEYRTGRNSKFVVEENGIISSFNGSTSIYHAEIKAVEGGYQIVYISSSYSAYNPTYINVVKDENGNLVVSEGTYQGIYVKASTSHYYNGKDANGNTCTIAQHQTANGLYYVYKANGAYSYATVTGALLPGGEAVITVNGESFNVKVTEGSYTDGEEGDFIFRGAEYGTYTGAGEDISLNGYCVASVGESATKYDYYMVGNKLVLSNGSTYLGYELSNNTYTALENDSYAGTYVRSDNDSYYFTLDGFGTVIDTYKGSYSTYTYYNTYTVSGKTLTITATGSDYNVKGNLSIEENGNVMIYNSYGTDRVYVKEGYLVVDQSETFLGETQGCWKDANDKTVVVSVETKKIAYGGTEISYTPNYNHSVITFKAVDSEDCYGYAVEYTATVVNGQLVITHVRNLGWDDIYEEYITENITETFAPFESDKTQDFVGANNGSWVDEEGNYVIINVENHSINIYGANYSYTANANHSVITFNAVDSEDHYGYARAHTATVVNGQLVITHVRYDGWDDIYEEYLTTEVTVTYTSAAEGADEGPYTGTWKGAYVTIVFIDSDTLTYDGSEYSYR